MLSSATVEKLSPDHSPLIQAINKNDLEGTSALLATNITFTMADFLSFSKNGYIHDPKMKKLLLQTLLLKAAISKDMDAVRFALSEGAEISELSHYDRTIMHVAAEMGHIDLMDELFKLKADCEIKQQRGMEPIHFAASSGRVEAIDWLLEHKVDIEATDKAGWTPLHFAAKAYKANAAKLLIDRGANLFALSHDGKLPVDLSCFSEPRKLLLNATLLAAAKINNIDMVKGMLQKFADVNAQSASGSTALHYAVRRNFGEMVNLLLEHKADVLLKDNEGIDAVAYSKTQKMVQLLSKPKLIANLKNYRAKNESLAENNHSFWSGCFGSSLYKKVRAADVILSLAEKKDTYNVDDLKQFDKLFKQDKELNEFKETIKHTCS